MTRNAIDEASKLIEKSQRDQLFIATVNGVLGNRVSIIRPSQSSADDQAFPRLESVGMLSAGDEVLVAAVGSGFIIVGKVLR